MQGLAHKIRCHPIHSYSFRKSAVTDSQSQLVRNSVPKIPTIAFLHESGRPWHELLVVESTAHDCSKRSRGSLRMIKECIIRPGHLSYIHFIEDQ